jgi:hypothetical protein
MENFVPDSKTGELDIEVSLAVWVFGIADAIYGDDKDAQQDGLSRTCPDTQEVLTGPFIRRDLQLTRPFGPKRLSHACIMQPIGCMREGSDFVPGCGCITGLDGCGAELGFNLAHLRMRCQVRYRPPGRLIDRGTDPREVRVIERAAPKMQRVFFKKPWGKKRT